MKPTAAQLPYSSVIKEYGLSLFINIKKEPIKTGQCKSSSTMELLKMELEMPCKVQRNLRQLALEIEKFFIPFFSFFALVEIKQGRLSESSEFSMGNFLSADNGTDCNRIFITGDRKCGSSLKDEIHQTATQKSRTEYWLLPYDCYGPPYFIVLGNNTDWQGKEKTLKGMNNYEPCQNCDYKDCNSFPNVSRKEKMDKRFILMHRHIFSPKFTCIFSLQNSKNKEYVYWFFFWQLAKVLWFFGSKEGHSCIIAYNCVPNSVLHFPCL